MSLSQNDSPKDIVQYRHLINKSQAQVKILSRTENVAKKFSQFDFLSQL